MDVIKLKLYQLTQETHTKNISKARYLINLSEPVDRSKLPAYLPSLPPPQVEEYQVYEKLRRLKSTKSTLPIDLPNKLRKEVEVELTKPLTIIINRCLSEGRFPALPWV